MPSAPTMPKIDSVLLNRLANTIRGLSIDAIEAANSGHPGLPLGCADLAVTLWYHFLRYNPEDPHWRGRDRFVLSAGHGSMLIYSLLHLAGYDLPLSELKAFRQFGSLTPGHPESHLTPGVETTTGPLGQGFATGVGMALGEKLLAARFHRDGFTPANNYVYGIVSDGDLMEGVALEAASFASHIKLGNLIYLYDDNNISLDGPTSLTFSHEKTAPKFEAMGWHVQTVDGFNHAQIAAAIVEAQKETTRPSIIICKTIIGYGSPNKANSHHVHGSPLGADEAALTKTHLGLPADKFHIPQEDTAAWAARKAENLAEVKRWNDELAAARAKYPEVVAQYESFFAQELPADLESKLPTFDPAKQLATRKAGEAVLKAIAPSIPWLVGGSADLSGSTNAILPGDVTGDNFAGRHLYFGVREHGMGSIVNGLVRHGAFRAFGATFLTFSDYMRGAIRIASLMECPSIYIFTHDSVFLGEDGPTHQPVEHTMALRLIPNLIVFRPGDAVEVGYAWLAALELTEHPSVIILSRQNLPTFDRSKAPFTAKADVAKGAYILRREAGGQLDGILIGTGSEVSLCVEAAERLEKDGYSIRVVSAPSFELFRKQDEEYQESVLPAACEARVGVEAGVSLGWDRLVGSKGRTVCLDHFGASAPAKRLAQEFGFTPENVAAKLRSVMGAR